MPMHLFGFVLMMISSFLTLLAVVVGFRGCIGACAILAAGAVFLGLHGLGFFGASITADIILGSLEIRARKFVTQSDAPTTIDPPQE